MLLFLLRFSFGLLQSVVVLILACLATGVLLLLDPPEFALDYLARLAEEQTLAFTGMPLEIGRIQTLKLRLDYQHLTLENVKLYGYKGAKEPALVLPRAELKLDARLYLLGGTGRNTLRIESPQVTLIRDAKGQINIRPHIKSGPKDDSPPGPRPQIPEVFVELVDGVISYTDQDPRYPLITRAHIPFIQGEIKDQEHVQATARVRSELANLDLGTRLNIWTGKAEAQLQADNPDVRKAAGYGARVKDLQVRAGSLKASARARWEDYSLKGLRYQGSADVRNLLAMVPYYKAPVTLSTQVELDEHEIRIAQLSVLTGANRISGRGKVTDYLTNRLALDTYVNIGHLRLEEVINSVNHPAMASVRALKASGTANSELHVHGPVAKLQIDGQLRVPGAVVKGIGIQQALARFRYRPEQVDLDQLNAGVFGGHLAGRGRVTLGKTMTLNAQAQARNISLDRVERELQIRMPEEYNPSGSVNATVVAQGPLTAPTARGTLSSPLLSFPNSQRVGNLGSVASTFAYSPARAELAVSTQSQFYGPLKLAAILQKMDGLQARLEAPSLPLPALNRWSPDNYLESGIANVSANVSGSLKQMQRNWMAFDAQANVQTANLGVQYPLKNAAGKVEQLQQQFDQLQIAMNWKQGTALIQKLDLTRNDSWLKGKGTLDIQRLLAKQGNRTNAIRLDLDGQVDIPDFPVLARYDVTGGHVDLDVKTTTRPNGDIQVALKTSAQALETQGIKLDKVALNSEYTGNRITIHSASVEKEDGRVDLDGNVTLAQDPVFDLSLRSDNLDAQTILALTPPAYKDKFTNPAPEAKIVPPADRKPIIYTLPTLPDRPPIFRLARNNPAGPPGAPVDPSQIKTQNVVIPLGEIIDKHWVFFKKDPDESRRLNALKETQQEQRPPLLDTLAGKLSLQMALKGTAKSPQVDLQTLIHNAKVYEFTMPESYLKARYNGQRIYVDQMHLTDASGSVLRAHGELDPNKDLFFEVTGKGISLGTANPMLPNSTRVEGGLDFVAVAEGSLKDPSVVARMHIEHLLANNYFFDKLETTTTYNDGYLRDLRAQLNADAQQIVVHGDLPVPNLNQPMDMTLRLEDESFGLINLFTNQLDWRRGKGSVLLRFVGTPRRPELEGSFLLSDTTVYLPALKEQISNIAIKGDINTNKVNLEYFRGDMTGGNLNVTGTMDLLNLLPSFLDLHAKGEKLKIAYTMPGLLETTVPVESADLRIKGLVNQPGLSGKINLGKGGEATFPFIRQRDPGSTKNEVGTDDDEAPPQSPPKVLFSGLTIHMPDDFGLHSPIFDVNVHSQQGITLRHRRGDMTLRGDIQASKGSLYLLNNVLEIEKLDVDFTNAAAPTATGNALIQDNPALNPNLDIIANFNVKGARNALDSNGDTKVKIQLKGTLEDLQTNNIKFTVLENRGLTDTEILAALSGRDTLEAVSQGNIVGAATQLSGAFLRGLFNPVTARLSSLLGLEDLDFGITGQTVNGPAFGFSVTSNPFFFLKDWIEVQQPSLKFLDRIRLSGSGELAEQVTFKFSTRYQIDNNWNFVYGFDQRDQVQSLRINGSYSLANILRWGEFFRQRLETQLAPIRPPQPSPSATLRPSATP